MEVGSPPPAPPEVLSPPSTREGEKKKLVTQDTLDSPSLSQTPSVSSEDPLSPVLQRKYWDYIHQDSFFSFAVWINHLYSFIALSFWIWTRDNQLPSIRCCQGDWWEAAAGSPPGACVFRMLQREDPGTSCSHAATSQTSMSNQRPAFMGYMLFMKDDKNSIHVCRLRMKLHPAGS